MSKFTDFEEFSHVAGSKETYKLNASLSWDIGKEGSEWTIIIPATIQFDISVPWPFHWFLSPHDRAVLPCAALHDQLLLQDFDRPFASAEFRRAAIARGQAPWRAWILFWATLVWTVITQRNAVRVIEKRRIPPEQK